MKTSKEAFQDFLRKEGFSISPVLSTMELIPHHRIDKDGNHSIIDNISVCIFGGSNVPEGGLGCVTFYYGGVLRKKYRKTAYQAEICKCVVVCETAKQAKKCFQSWRLWANNKLNEMKVVL